MPSNSGQADDGATFAPAYERWRASALGRITDEIETRLLLQLLGDTSGRRILDIGCGDGELAVSLSRRGAQVTGIDRSKQALASARARAQRQGAKLTLTVADARNLPFRDEMFDVAVAVAVLCFIEETDRVIAEAARVLRPGGLLVIGELGRWNAWAVLRRVRGWLGHPVWSGARFRSPAELRGAARRAGLTVEELRGAVFYPPFEAAAKRLGRFDAWIGRRTTFGAAFLALSATKMLSDLRDR